MKLREFSLCSKAVMALLLAVFGSFLGCSRPDADPAAAALNQEREKLLAENQTLPDVRTEHEEVDRLVKDNQELPKVRSQYQEAIRLRKENEQLRQQLAKLTPPTTATNAIPNAPGPTPASVAQGEPKKELTLEEGALADGDDIMIEPKYLKLLIPDFDWEKLGRKEPLGVKGLLEKDGVRITNAVQMREYGLTNFVIRRARQNDSATPPP